MEKIEKVEQVKRQSTEWRKFELLVTQIERQLAPKGAVVKSPDKIKDKITRRMREVDASIRYEIDSKPFLITVECRKRNKKQDDTWLEQVITKRDKIGANRTIVVSEKGFSKSAILTAQHYGIDLRRIDDITDSEIADWINKVTIEKVNYQDNILAFNIEVEGDCDKFSHDIEKMIGKAPFDSPILFQTNEEKSFSIRDLLDSIYSWRWQGNIGDEVFVGMDSSGSVKRKFTISISVIV